MTKRILTAFCDLALCPVSYDFCVWMIRAMRERDIRGCDGLHIVLVPNEGGLGNFAGVWGEHDEAATRWRLQHIIMACIPLAGPNTTVTLAPEWTHARLLDDPRYRALSWWPEGRCHLAGPLIEQSRKGEAIPKLQLTEAARRYVARWLIHRGAPESGRIVTLTIRDQSTHSDRNSNRAAFEAMMDMTFDAGYWPITLEETDIALSKGNCFPEIDPDLRLALYERAAMNCIGNNGPAALLWFSDAPFLQFGYGLPAKKWTAHMEEHLSMKPGDQLPWAKPNQRLIWRPDSFEVMKEEFERCMPS